MTTTALAAALRGCAVGLYPLEAGTGLLIAHGTFLHRCSASTSPATPGQT